jgi:hypothetical protein
MSLCPQLNWLLAVGAGLSEQWEPLFEWNAVVGKNYARYQINEVVAPQAYHQCDLKAASY